ncbi:Gfo/Idh/MocA family oxidoreductase [Gottschalkiaceae bacterium SANA]|nr:Gfo/Idh/MocA family oxidoreductase [Gottschalkiaceae bacterium SANA]
MKIGVIGLGNIAEKAYLPLLSSFPDHEFIPCTRNKERLDLIQSKYHFKNGRLKYTDLVEIDQVDAVFIHAATNAHASIIRYFLESNIHVYVDKPISESILESRELCTLAKEKHLVLMVGFNRRFAPHIQPLTKIDGDLVVIQKNRQTLTLGLRELIYDDFIHIVDTLLYLLKEQPITTTSTVKMNGHKLQHVSLMIQTKNKTGLAIMNRQSGANEERLEFSATQEKWIIEDLETVHHYKNGQKTISKHKDWTPISERRGFKQTMEAFFGYIESPEKSIEPLELSLSSHEICEEIIQTYTSKTD